MNFMFLPLEDKIHIFSPPCNILYIYDTNLDAIRERNALGNQIYMQPQVIVSDTTQSGY